MADKRLIIRLHSLGDVVLASGAAAVSAGICETAFATREIYLPVVERIPGGVTPLAVRNGWRELRELARGFTHIADLQNNTTTKLALAGKNPGRFHFSRTARRRVLRGSGELLPWRAAEYLAACDLEGDPTPVLERRHHPDNASRTVGIVVGGRWAMKSIPNGVITELARLFCDIMNASVHLLGDSSNRQSAEMIREEAGYRDVTVLAGKGGIGELMEYIEQLDLLISPDSGPAHLGIALGVPTMVVFTSTSPSLGFYRNDMPGIHQVQVPCRPCHRHGGKRCRAGDQVCRNMLVPRKIYEEAVCLMQ